MFYHLKNMRLDIPPNRMASHRTNPGPIQPFYKNSRLEFRLRLNFPHTKSNPVSTRTTLKCNFKPR